MATESKKCWRRSASAARVRLGPPGVRHVVAPVVVDLAEDLELLGEVHLFALLLGPRLWRAVGAAGGLVAVRVGLAVLRVLGVLLLGAHALHGKLLERRIGLELLLDHRAQVERGDLQDLERLAQLRRKDERLRLALPKILAETSCAHRL